MSLGRLFPQVPALIARQSDGFLLVSASGARTHVRGPICEEIEESLAAGAATPRLARLAAAHQALGDLAGWLTTPAVPLTRQDAIRLDGFDTLFVELLGRCNERCLHCYADSSPAVTDALDRQVVLSVIDQAAEIGFRRIQFTGGDPLLSDYLPEAVERAAARGIPYREIYTNGLALGERLLAELAPSEPAFAFSVYSLDPEVHDRITRTPGSHRRTLAAIDRVVEHDLKARAAIVVLEDNAEDVDALVDHLQSRGVGFVSWTRTFAVGRGVEAAQASRAVGNGGRSAPRLAEGGGHSGPGDSAGLGKLCVSYSGDVVPCIFQRQSVLGNVNDGTSLADIISGAACAKLPRRGLPVAEDARQRLQCGSCRLTDVALGWLGRSETSAP